MLRQAVLSFALSAVAVHAADSSNWVMTFGDDRFWTKVNARYAAKDQPERKFTYSALRFDRVNYEYELVDMERLLKQAYPKQSSDGLVYDASTQQFRALEISIGQAWDVLQDDPSVVALIPMGFARAAGDARIVGYRKIDGQLFRGLFSARNLDSILCLDDVADPRKNTYPHQIPLLLGVNLEGQKFTYNYLDGLEAINLRGYDDEGIASDGYYNSRLAACPDAVQVGPRVIQPRNYEPAAGAKGRLAANLDSVASDRHTARVVMLYDWNGWVNFIRTDGASTLYDLGTLVSSDEYYDNVPCKWGPVKPSQSCEIWAVTVAAFDDAAMVVRTEDGVEFWGDPRNFSPGVLVIRKKAPALPVDRQPAPKDSETNSADED